MSTTRTARPSLVSRIRTTMSDDVLRILAVATSIKTVGRGIVLTLAVLYLTLVIELPAEQIALVYTIGAAAAIGASYFGGHLADIISARRLEVVLSLAMGATLASLALVTSFWSAVLVEVLASVAWAASGSVRSAIIARAFVGPARVTSRAVLRTITNVGISLGGGVGAIALVLGTPEAYRAIFVAGGIACALCAIPLSRLPQRVDAVRATPEADAEPVAAGRSPWRDGRYLLFSALAAVFAMQFGVVNIGLPLWLALDTVAPEWMMSVLLVINTALVIALQVPMSRGTHDLRRAGSVTAVAGVLMAAACVLYGGAGGAVLVAAIVLLIAATVVHAFAEILSQAGAWGLSFELADPARAGAYQGVYSMGFSVGSLVAPLLIAATALEHGLAGWIALAAMFLASALGVTGIAFRAARTAPASA